MALAILMKGHSLNWTEDNQIHDNFKACRKRKEMLITDTEERAPRIHLSLHKGLVNGDRLGTHWIGRSHRWLCYKHKMHPGCPWRSLQAQKQWIVAATVYKPLVQVDLGLPEYIEKCKEITAACNFEAAYDKCLWNAIHLGLRNLRVYEECNEVGDRLASADVICIATDVYILDRQLSIMYIPQKEPLQCRTLVWVKYML